jgi:hypothetical protein
MSSDRYWFRERALSKPIFFDGQLCGIIRWRKPNLSEKSKPIEVWMPDLNHLYAKAIFKPLRGQVSMTPCLA